MGHESPRCVNQSIHLSTCCPQDFFLDLIFAPVETASKDEKPEAAEVTPSEEEGATADATDAPEEGGTDAGRGDTAETVSENSAAARSEGQAFVAFVDIGSGGGGVLVLP